jgi:hypothetical protein
VGSGQWAVAANTETLKTSVISAYSVHSVIQNYKYLRDLCAFVVQNRRDFGVLALNRGRWLSASDKHSLCLTAPPAAPQHELAACDGHGPGSYGKITLVGREVVMRVARVILEPRAAQAYRDGHLMELLQAIVAEVVACHVAPVLPAARAVVIAANIVYQDHLRAIVACRKRSATCVKRRLFRELVDMASRYAL